MADRRAVRASSRLKTPTPQPPSKPNTPRTGRATRPRGARSASRDVELPVEAAKPARRSARQVSVTSIASESEQEVDAARKPRTKRKGRKEAIGEPSLHLATVEEADTQIAIEEIPNTPPRHGAPAAVPHRSPGTVSEMSGTTAISSFSMVEAELLDPASMIRKLRKLYETSQEFLSHLAPEDGRVDEDQQHIHDMQMPDSRFSADYRDFDEEITVHLSRFRGEHQRFISLKAVHRALLGPHRDPDAARTGLDLVLYMANMLIFAKQMIHTHRSEKDTWDTLRELDSFFPTQFLRDIILGSDPSTGDSAVLHETFQLALDLRTQLAILYLERSLTEDNFNPDDIMEDVFFQSENGLIRGWNVTALGGEDSVLPQAFQSKVIERIHVIRGFFSIDDESVDRGDVADIDGLGANFPWGSLVLRLLGWVRSRNKELEGAIQTQGGIKAIVANVQTEMDRPGAASAPRESPRKKRSSFGKVRRRSSQKFDPNAEVNTSLIDKLIAKERSAAVQPRAPVPVPQSEEELQEAPAIPEEQDDWVPPVDNEPLDNEVQRLIEEEAEEFVEEPTGSARPPQSTAETLRLLKQGKRLGKENRVGSLFERQANARRVEFGDGFGEDTQPTPGPSRPSKQPQQSAPKKRRLSIEPSDNEDDAYETIPRTAGVQQQRERAKRVRIDPNSSGAPTSHQPRARDEDTGFQPAEPEESPSENEAPNMTEEAPPTSTFRDQKELARANFRPLAAARPRKSRAEWTPEAEEALVEYMATYPRGYSQILKHDEFQHRLLQDRTQVNLKDKVRNMAIVMIKSGTGLRAGFEDVITPNSKIGQQLVEEGFEW
ncbi:hypothetical protein K458DRAFT_295764 [Lentithecium fluviatile CBS 122367]|uniref:Myb-like domain-containing protein n=1 Tax=Lentithecium fluviatile CBS 122367 TaxID=1168545 RepID=A0A6G1JA89_9PLEO|nr:hypothetical protein K458DRAFT_295764 [Lentithecium fluviatile CBS 122367]